MNPIAAPLQLTGVHLQPYNEIIRPGQVWKISKYFLRRWTPYLPASSIWLVIGARQESYFNGNRPWFKAYDASLAAAAGIHVRSFRRAAKKEIAQGRGALATFIHKTGDPAYLRGQAVPKQTETRYEVRLDDPLAPADAAHLAGWLRQHAPQPVTAETVAALLAEARAEAPQALRAAEIAPEAADSELLTVADVVAAVFPAVKAESGWREAADRLHTHIVEPQLFHMESQYLRHKWVGELGPGPALLLIFLRSLCYHNPQTGEIRNEVALRSGTLEQLFQKSSVTLRAWFGRLEDMLGDGHPHGPFLQATGSRKLPTQQVETTYRLNLLTPLHPDDLPRYRKRVAQQPHTNGHRPEEEEGVTKVLSATTDAGDESFVSHVHEGGESFVSHGNAGDESFVSHLEQGETNFVSGWQRKWQPYKYYKHFLAALEPAFKTLFLKKTKQQQHLWKLDGGQALQPFAAAAVTSVEGLLDHFSVQGSTRRQIVRAGLPVEGLVAWYLYAEREPGLAHPARYMMKQAAAGAAPPAQFLALARLSWEQWRSYATVCLLEPWLAPDLFARQPHFTRWRALYGDEAPARLPFGVGDGLADLVTAFRASDGRAPGVPKQQAAPAADSDADYWRLALQDLALQMTRATFNSWLGDARFLRREEDTFVIAVRNEAAQAWLSHRLRAVVLRELAAVVGRPVEVRFVVEGENGEA